jgi:NitT/TauT family transport system permease protein
MPEALRTALATLTTVTAVILLWDAAITWYGTPSYLLPRPAEVAVALHQGWIGGSLHEHAAFTVTATAAGFAAGAVAGIALGAMVAEVRPLSLAIYPLVIATQSMPTVAIAPLIVVYLGVGMGSKVVTVGLLCFFPLFVNTVAGIRGADPALVDLYRAHGAGRWRLFRDVKLPGAVDPIMAGVQVAVVLAFVGCVVSEFVASTRGLGYLIRAVASDMNVALMFAAIVSLGTIGALAGGLAHVAHRRLVPWRQTGFSA